MQMIKNLSNLQQKNCQYPVDLFSAGILNDDLHIEKLLFRVSPTVDLDTTYLHIMYPGYLRQGD